MTRLATLSVAVTLCACTGSQPGNPPAPDETGQAALADKVWVAADASAAPGTFRIFLTNGTLVMDSCWETYRLAAWRRIDDRRVEWTEDTARIEARVGHLSADRLELELRLGDEVQRQLYQAAQVPTVCPDMPR